jgi:hypothetical protein
MFELKSLSHDAVPAALEKANRYRLLNEPSAAESIYLDILAVEPDNQEALKNIVLAMSDRFGKDYAVGDTHINEYVTQITDGYEKAYYTGIVYERRAKATLAKGGLQAYSCLLRLWDGLKRPKRYGRPGTTIRYSVGMAALELSNATSFNRTLYPPAIP